MRKRIVLASSSPFRRSLMERAGLKFEVIEPQIDEAIPKGMSFEQAVVHIARSKLENVRVKTGRDAVIIASDQLLEAGGNLVGKPGTKAAAVEMLLRLAGKEHRLLTSLVVEDGYTGRYYEHLDVHLVRLRHFTREEADYYVRLDSPQQCTGGLKIESLGIWLVEGIYGGDWSAVVGLPMIALTGILREVGCNVLDQGMEVVF